MSDVYFSGNFLRNAKGLTFADSASFAWTYDPTTGKLSGAGGSPGAGSVTNAMLANMAQSTIKGRAAGAGAGAPVDLSVAQVKAILALASTDLSDFTEAAQDAAGALIGSSSTVSASYNDAGNTLLMSVVLTAAYTWTGRHIFSPAAGATTINGIANSDALDINGSSTSGQSFGLLLTAGTTSADYAIFVRNAAGSATFFRINGDGKMGFNGATPVAKPTVTGSKGANAALTSLLTALASLGLITDSST